MQVFAQLTGTFIIVHHGILRYLPLFSRRAKLFVGFRGGEGSYKQPLVFFEKSQFSTAILELQSKIASIFFRSWTPVKKRTGVQLRKKKNGRRLNIYMFEHCVNIHIVKNTM